MSLLYDALYLIEPLPVFGERLSDRVDPGLAQALLEPRLFRQREGGRSDWVPADREAAAKLLFLASLREYALLQSTEGFAVVFGASAVSVALFDTWFSMRRFMVDDDLELLEPWLRGCPLPVEPSARFVVDRWLSDVRGLAEPRAAADPGHLPRSL